MIGVVAGFVSVDDNGREAYTPNDSTNAAASAYQMLLSVNGTAKMKQKVSGGPAIINPDGTISPPPPPTTVTVVHNISHDPTAKQKFAEIANGFALWVCGNILGRPSPEVRFYDSPLTLPGPVTLLSCNDLWDAGPSGDAEASTTAAPAPLAMLLDVPHGQNLGSASVTITPAKQDPNTPRQTLPAVMPTLDVYSVTAAGVATALAATATDSSPTALAYGQPHTLTIAFVVTANRSTTRYVVVVNGESGAGSIPGLRISPPVWS